MYFLLASSVMFVMFAIEGNCENEIIKVLGRSVEISTFSISGYLSWMIVRIASSSMKRMFLWRKSLRSPVMLFVRLAWVTSSVTTFISSILK